MLTNISTKENNLIKETTKLVRNANNEPGSKFRRTKTNGFGITYKPKDFPSRVTARDEIGALANFLQPILLQSTMFQTPI